MSGPAETLAEPLIAANETAVETLSEKLLPEGDKTEIVTIDNDAIPSFTDWTRGEVQPSTCKDGLWTILFLLQLTVIGILAVAWGIPELPQMEGTTGISYTAFAILSGYMSLGACAVTSAALYIMTRFAKKLIQITILFNLCMSCLVVVLSILTGNIFGAIFGSVMLLLCACYVYTIWPLIPWAASNLTTAVTCITANLSIALVAMGMVVLSMAFTFLWALAYGGSSVHLQAAIKCGSNTTTTLTQDYGDDDTDGECDKELNGFMTAIFVLLFFWTQQVIKNILRVTVAGVVGTWWFAPHEANSFCSPCVKDSLVRATTTSFGSICLGSLLVAMIRLLHQMVYNARRHGRGNQMLLCVLECLTALLESFMEYFNKWGFVYVGLYGYSYWEAGPKVMTLFRDRGWSAVLSDQLVYRVLNFMSFIMGILSGFVGLLAISIHPHLLQDVQGAGWIAFTLGLIIGMVLSNILLSIISSAVDTVVVCFAEAPLEFRSNYPELSETMEQAWHQTFPSEYRIVADSTLV